jgi:Type II secretion system (T2SS), protein G
MRPSTPEIKDVRIIAGQICRIRRQMKSKTKWSRFPFNAVPLLLALGCSPKQALKDGKTKTDIHIVSVAIGVYEMDNHHFPASEGSTQDHELDVDTLYRILSTTNTAGRVYMVTGKSTMMDPWGHPFHIWVDGDGDGKVTIKTPTGTLVVNSPIAIWADGQNGINEYGGGDDVSSWRDP